MTLENILEQSRDHDTLGGRISRAREAIGMDAIDAATNMGVTQETYDNWESDRDEPRANKLAMLAGVLSVSPSWLLHGVGESPISETFVEELSNLKAQIIRLQELHEQTGTAIQTVEQAIERLSVNNNQK